MNTQYHRPILRFFFFWLVFLHYFFFIFMIHHVALFVTIKEGKRKERLIEATLEQNMKMV